MQFSELLTLLKTAKTEEEICQHKEEIFELIPEARKMDGYDQQNYTHPHLLFEHCVYTVLGLPKTLEDDMIYLAALVHDIGKPDCQIYDTHEGKVNMHYYGHPLRSMEIVRDQVIPEWLSKGIALSFEEQRRLLYYVEYHDDHMKPTAAHVAKHKKAGANLEEFQALMWLQVADAKDHLMIPVIEERVRICEELAGLLGEQLYNTNGASI